jgi:hypothetical protein
VLALVALALLLLVGAGPALAQGGEGVRGTLNNGGERVAGATITVEQDGEEVGTAESDENGQFAIELPGPGDYVVKLDLETLPEGVTVARRAARSARSPSGRAPSHRRCSCWVRAPGDHRDRGASAAAVRPRRAVRPGHRDGRDRACR